MRESGARRTLLAILVLLAVGLAAQLAYAQQATTSVFDHFSTGFPLIGSHFSVDCESCHQGGRFKGTPNRCGACHDGSIAAGKSPQHSTTSDFCESCHAATTWSQVVYDHSQAVGTCASCHDGSHATGKPPTHITTSAPCESCHKSTFTFTSASFDHAGIAGDCASCHNGKTASGKPSNHIGHHGSLRDLSSQHDTLCRSSVRP